MSSNFFPPLPARLVLATLLLGLGGIPVEAGLFERLKARRKARTEVAEKVKPTPRPRYRSHYRDAHGDAYLNEGLLAGSVGAVRKVVIDIERQRAFLVIDGLVAIDCAVSTARRGKHTTRGRFPITEKVESGKVSTLYHVFMPCWMRLGQTTIGMHVGDLPGYPASAGCIRLPQSVAPVFFQHTQLGDPVEVVDFWNEAGLRLPYSPPQPPHFGDT